MVRELYQGSEFVIHEHSWVYTGSSPGEGRARQIVANSVRQRKDKAKVVPFLLHWREVEVDEFTKEAISAALEGVDLNLHSAYKDTPLPDIVDTYRYVAGRLCHRIRNSLANPSARLRRLQSFVEELEDAATRVAIVSEISQIMDAFQKVSRLVEFDVGDAYFQHRPIALKDWITAMSARYSVSNEPVTTVVVATPTEANYRIRANDQYLETIFWNLWTNSTQAVQSMSQQGIRCQISITMKLCRLGRLELIVADNGPGIPQNLADTLLTVGFSTKGEGRGRGLLEVQDAVRRLFGTIKLVAVNPNEYRVQMSFPLETI